MTSAFWRRSPHMAQSEPTLREARPRAARTTHLPQRTPIDVADDHGRAQVAVSMLAAPVILAPPKLDLLRHFPAPAIAGSGSVNSAATSR